MKKRILSLLLCLVLLLGALPIPAAAAENPFVDVSESDYYYDAVLWAYETGVTVGVDATHFGPDATVTRGQAVTFLWRAMGEPEPRSTENPFADVKESDWFYQPVLWAVEQGITVGTDAAHFSPNQTCSTMHIITFLYRTLGMGENGWGQAGADWAANEGLLDDTGLTVETGVNCPRAAVVTTLDRTVGDAAHGTLITEDEMELVYEGDGTPPANSTAITDEDFAELSVDAADVYTGEATALHFELESGLIVPAFTLRRDGASTSTLLTDEDEDGVYTGSFTLTQYGEGEVRFTATVTLGGKTLESNEATVWVTAPLSAQTEQTMDEVLGAVDGLMQSAIDGLPEDASEEEKAEARAAAIEEYLEGESGYWETTAPTPTSPGGSCWVPGRVDKVERGTAERGDPWNVYYTIDGVECIAACRAPEEGDSSFGSSGTAAVESSRDASAPALFARQRCTEPLGLKALVLCYHGKDDKDVYGYNPGTVEWVVVKDVNEVMISNANNMTAELQKAGYAVTTVWDMTVDDLKKLQGYDFIHIEAHGGHSTFYTCICTQEEVTNAKNKRYEQDLKSKRISPVSTTEGRNYWINPSFFSAYYPAGKKLNAQVLNLNICDGTFNGAMPNALTAAGAKSILAYHNTVYTKYAGQIARKMLQEMIDGKNLMSAWYWAMQEYGKDESVNYPKRPIKDAKNNIIGYKDPGAPVVIGDTGLTLGFTAYGDLLDGDFEWISRIPWNTWGYSWLTSRFFNFYSGGKGYRFAHVGTGSSVYDDDYRGEVWQTVRVPENATRLYFDYRLLTRELDRPAGQKLQDYFSVALVDPATGKTLASWSFSIAKLAQNPNFFLKINGNKGNASSEKGPYWCMRGWYRTGVDVSRYRGKLVNVCFIAQDTGNTSYDTHALIDNVKFT